MGWRGGLSWLRGGRISCDRGNSLCLRKSGDWQGKRRFCGISRNYWGGGLDRCLHATGKNDNQQHKWNGNGFTSIWYGHIIFFVVELEGVLIAVL